jgi:biopolymer transport protein ExbB/TolQ
MADQLMAAAQFVWYYVHNFYYNVTHMLDGMNMTRWLRLVVVVAAYLLLRPYIMKFMSHEQTAQFKTQTKKDDDEREKVAKAKISPNSIRGQVEIPDSGDEEGETIVVEGSEPQWGTKARKRTRRAMKELIEEQEKRLEEEDMEDIKDLLESDVLVDFEEGKDGW